MTPRPALPRIPDQPSHMLLLLAIPATRQRILQPHAARPLRGRGRNRRRLADPPLRPRNPRTPRPLPLQGVPFFSERPRQRPARPHPLLAVLTRLVRRDAEIRHHPVRGKSVRKKNVILTSRPSAKNEFTP